MEENFLLFSIKNIVVGIPLMDSNEHVVLWRNTEKSSLKYHQLPTLSLSLSMQGGNMASLHTYGTPLATNYASFVNCQAYNINCK